MQSMSGRFTAQGGGWRVGARRTAVALAMFCANVHAAEPPSAVIDVRPGDTFSGIAARFTGDVRQWRKLYDPLRSGLPNPDLIQSGAQLELVKNADGSAYLRVVPRGTPVPDTIAQAPAPTVAAPKPAPAPAATLAPPSASPSARSPADAAPAPGDTLTVGLLPYIPATALLKQFEPMKQYLERVTRRPIRMVTAPGFKPFFDSTVRGEYDIVVSASHFARVAQLDAALTPLVIFEPRIRALLVASSDQPAPTPESLRGKAIAFANPQSLVAMYANEWLAQQNLQSGKDYKIVPARTDLGVGRLVLSGEAAAAVLSNGEFRQIPAEESSRLKIVHEIARIPNFVVLAHPRLGAQFSASLKGQLKDFPADKSDGAAFTKGSGVTAMIDADEAQMRELDAYVDQTRRAMGGGR